MKKLLCTASFLLFLIPSISFAQSDFSVTWDISGLIDDVIIEVTYDLDVGTNYISAHGAASFLNGLSQPSTGTCFITGAGGIFCNVSINALNAILDIGATLDGTIQIISADGILVTAGVMTLKSVL